MLMMSPILPPSPIWQRTVSYSSWDDEWSLLHNVFMHATEKRENFAQELNQIEMEQICCFIAKILDDPASSREKLHCSLSILALLACYCDGALVEIVASRCGLKLLEQLTNLDCGILKNALASLAHLLEKVKSFGKTAVAFDSMLAPNLCILINSPLHDVRLYAIKIITILVRNVAKFRKLLINGDRFLGQTLSHLLEPAGDSENKYHADIRRNAVRTIAVLLNKISSFGKTGWSEPERIQLGAKLSSVLLLDAGGAVVDASTQGNAAWALAGLLFHIEGFGEELLAIDPFLGVKLCKLLGNPAVTGKVALALAFLVHDVVTEGVANVVTASDSKIGLRLSDEYSAESLGVGESNGIYHAAKVVEKVLTEHGKEIIQADPSLGDKLCEGLAGTNDKAVYKGVWAIGTMTEYVPGFGDAVVAHARSNLRNNLVSLLMDHPTKQIKAAAAITLTALADKVPHFTAGLERIDSALAAELLHMLHHRGEDHNYVRSSAVKAIALAASKLERFGSTITSLDNSLGSKLIALLVATDEKANHYALVSLRILIQKFGVLGISDPTFDSNINFLLGSDSDAAHMHVLDVIDLLLTHMESFKDKFLSDHVFLCRICRLLTSPNLKVQRRTALLIWNNLNQVPGFANTITASDPALGPKLCGLFAVDDDTIKRKAVCILSTLFHDVLGFGQAIAASCPSVGPNLCELLQHPDDDIKSHAALAIAILVHDIHDFGESIVNDCPLLPKYLCSLVLSANEDVKENSLCVVANLLNQLPEFSGTILHEDELLATKLCDVLTMTSRETTRETTQEVIPHLCESAAPEHDDAIGCSHDGAASSLVSKLCELLNLQQQDLSKSAQIAVVIGNLVDKHPVRFGKLFALHDAALSARLCTLTSVDNSDPIRAQAAAAVAKLVERIPGFGNVLLMTQGNFGLILSNLLASPNENVCRPAANVIGHLVPVIPGFGELLAALDPRLARHLCQLFTIEPSSTATKFMASLAMANLCSRINMFAEDVLASDPLIAGRLCNLLGSGESEESQNYVIRSLASMLEKLGKKFVVCLVSQEPSLAAKLSFCLSRANEETRYESCNIITTLLQHSSAGFGTALNGSDCCVGTKLSAMMKDASVDKVKVNAGQSLAILMEVVPGFAENLVFADRMLGQRLIEFISSSLEQKKAIAIRMMSILFFQIVGYGQALVVKDPTLGCRICAMMGNKDRDVVTDVVNVLTTLLDEVYGFGVSIMQSDPTLGFKLCNLLISNDSPDLVAGAAFLIRSLVEETPGFVNTIISSDPLIGHKLALLLYSTNTTEITKGYASAILSNLVSASPKFGKMILAANPTIPSSLFRLLTSVEDDTKGDAAMCLATLMDVIPNFASGVFDDHPNELEPLLLYLLENDADNTKANASRMVTVLATNVPKFAQDLVNKQSPIISMVQDLSTHSNLSLANWSERAAKVLKLQERISPRSKANKVDFDSVDWMDNDTNSSSGPTSPFQLPPSMQTPTKKRNGVTIMLPGEEMLLSPTNSQEQDLQLPPPRQQQQQQQEITYERLRPSPTLLLSAMESTTGRTWSKQ